MSVPSAEVLQANGGKPPPGGMPPEPGPGAAPMMSPQKNEGAQAQAKTQCLNAQKILEHALAAFGSGSEEGKAVLKAISALAKAFGKNMDTSEELSAAEKMMMLQGLQGPGSPPKPQGPPPGGPPGAGAAPPQPPPPGA